jgi:hypothetical protein
MPDVTPYFQIITDSADQLDGEARNLFGLAEACDKVGQKEIGEKMLRLGHALQRIAARLMTANEAIQADRVEQTEQASRNMIGAVIAANRPE